MKQIFAILGGDSRQISLAARLFSTGAEVHCFGLPEEALAAGVLSFEDWGKAIDGADAVILPLPASPDGVRIHQPLCPLKAPPSFAEVLLRVPAKTPLFGGKFSPAMKALAEEQGHLLIDFCKSEEFQQKNAVPTAEGAVAIFMERIPRTVKGSPVAVTGFGRIAKALISILLSLGADVAVGARKPADLEMASAMGCKTVRLCGDADVATLCKGRIAVFNTVPHWLFTREVLFTVERDMLLIDLASSPGGVDAEVARALNLPVIWALSLPGKYAPVTAGEIIADTVLSLFQGEVIP